MTKVIFVADCKDCPYCDTYIFCLFPDTNRKEYEVPDIGIRPDCPLEELGVVSGYRRGGTKTNK